MTIDQATTSADILKPYLDRLAELGVTGECTLTISGYWFSGHFDWEGPHQTQFGYRTWGDVEAAALAHVESVNRAARYAADGTTRMLESLP